ncbi:unnamed protein product [Adineta ricciae]|uniref:Uncharacterized protein n=1 Tax=Adineta ricciae TaxID=249248 RepID=A0A815K872_ADIRI|nr:unnamed protein product [Adineta ricciae]
MNILSQALVINDILMRSWRCVVGGSWPRMLLVPSDGDEDADVIVVVVVVVGAAVIIVVEFFKFAICSERAFSCCLNSLSRLLRVPTLAAASANVMIPNTAMIPSIMNWSMFGEAAMVVNRYFYSSTVFLRDTYSLLEVNVSNRYINLYSRDTDDGIK